MESNDRELPPSEIIAVNLSALNRFNSVSAKDLNTIHLLSIELTSTGVLEKKIIALTSTTEEDFSAMLKEAQDGAQSEYDYRYQEEFALEETGLSMGDLSEEENWQNPDLELFANMKHSDYLNRKNFKNEEWGNED